MGVLRDGNRQEVRSDGICKIIFRDSKSHLSEFFLLSVRVACYPEVKVSCFMNLLFRQATD